jgi:hypothetical protein
VKSISPFGSLLPALRLSSVTLLLVLLSIIEALLHAAHAQHLRLSHLGYWSRVNFELSRNRYGTRCCPLSKCPFIYRL